MKFYIKLLMTLLFVGALGACTSNEPIDTADSGDQMEDSTAEIADASADDIASDDFGDFEDFEEDFGDAEGDASSDFADDTSADMADASDTSDADSSFEDDSFADSGSEDMADDSSSDEELTDDLLSDTSTEDSVADLGGDDWSTSDDSSMSSDEMAGLESDSSFGDDSSSFEETSTANVVPLNKMLTTPYRKAGQLVNAIYIVRDGDSFESLATKIYGDSSRADDLRAVNTHLSSRDMVVGDKIYYNSPQRPNDESALRVYYEDVGLTPEIYVAQAGDNIRTVGKSLLGSNKSWKELYATNMDVQSKDLLDEGTQLRYWSGDFSAPPVAPVAAVESAPPAPPEPMMEEDAPPMPEEPDVAMNEPMPAESDLAMNEPVAAGTVDTPPPAPPKFDPPPPPPAVNVPPPKPIAPKASAPADSGSMGMGDDSTALMAGAILLIAAVLMVIIIRKRKAKKTVDFQTATQTQID